MLDQLFSRNILLCYPRQTNEFEKVIFRINENKAKKPSDST